MTATTNEVTPDTAQKAGGLGRVSRIIGPVIDVEFAADEMPEMEFCHLIIGEIDRFKSFGY